MPDKISPEIKIRLLQVIRPTVFNLTRSNIEYLIAMLSCRLIEIGGLERFAALRMLHFSAA